MKYSVIYEQKFKQLSLFTTLPILYTFYKFSLTSIIIIAHFVVCIDVIFIGWTRRCCWTPRRRYGLQVSDRWWWGVFVIWIMPTSTWLHCCESWTKGKMGNIATAYIIQKRFCLKFPFHIETRYSCNQFLLEWRCNWSIKIQKKSQLCNTIWNIWIGRSAFEKKINKRRVNDMENGDTRLVILKLSILMLCEIDHNE